MATIRKRRDKWQVQVRRKGHKQVSETFFNRKDAELWGRKVETAIDLGQPIELEVGLETLRDLLQKYLQEITPKKKGKDAESRRLSRLLRDSISRNTIQAIDGKLLSQFRDRRIKDGVRACQYDLVLIRHALEIGRKEWGLQLRSNPVDDIRVPNGIRRRERRLLPGEYVALQNAVASTRNRCLWPMIDMAIETAMRRSELLRLDWSHIDLENGLAYLDETKNGHSRTVPLTKNAISVLSSLSKRSVRVFPTSEYAVRQAWERLVARAGIKDLRFHDLRHEAVSRLFERGLAVPEVALISGHKDPRMLFRYTHLNAQDVAAKLHDTEKGSSNDPRGK